MSEDAAFEGLIYSVNFNGQNSGTEETRCPFLKIKLMKANYGKMKSQLLKFDHIYSKDDAMKLDKYIIQNYVMLNYPVFIATEFQAKIII